MKLYSLNGNCQQLDGGAMFGNVPQSMWSKWLAPDSQNRIQLACRCLLIQVNDFNILLETGIGSFFEPKLKERYGVLGNEHQLLASLQEGGLTHEDIDVVILSHLHFDHAGGLLSAYLDGSPSQLLFPNAKYLVSKGAWERAKNPHPRDKASFIPALIKLLELSDRLIIIEGKDSILGPEFKFHYSDGHTPGMLLTEIKTPNGILVFAADLIPGKAWVHLPITMGYDRFPELVINEKQCLLEYLYEKHGSIFFTHDPEIACAKIDKDERNNYVAVSCLSSLTGIMP